MQTISRAALIQTIEASIARARTLDPTEKLALRLVALTADEVSIGDFANCPLTQAGQGSNSPASINTEYEAQERFYDCFDPLVRRVTGNYSTGTLTVVE